MASAFRTSLTRSAFGKPTLIHHFASKDDVAIATSERASDSGAEPLLAKTEERTPRERLDERDDSDMFRVIHGQRASACARAGRLPQSSVPCPLRYRAALHRFAKTHRDRAGERGARRCGACGV